MSDSSASVALSSALAPSAPPRHFARDLAVFYGATFLCVGVHMPFFPAWLKAEGLSSAWIGLIVSLPLIARLTAVPLATRLAERFQVVRQALIAGCVLTVLGFAALGFVSGPWAILLVYAVTSAIWTPVLPLTDAYALHGVRRYGIVYGPIRLWGSAAFIVSALAAGALIPLIGDRNTIWILAATALLAVTAGLRLQPDERMPASDSQTRYVDLLRLPGVVPIMIATALIQGSHALYYGFGTIDWRAHGLGDGVISLMWSLGVAAEIALFALSPRLPFGFGTLMMIGAGAAVLRWMLAAFEPQPVGLAAIQLLHGLTYGATQLGTVYGLARVVPTGRVASAQGLLVAVNGAVMALATIGVGWLYGAAGSYAYVAMVFLGLSGGAAAWWAQHAIARAGTPTVEVA